MKRGETVVQLEARREEQRAGMERTPPPLYGVAMLRIALELKRPGAGSLDTLVHRVTARMGLEEGPFRAYLERDGGLLRTLVPQRD
ncbi:MAG: hypothetical protein L0Y66_08740 [Myxococcaceae bacterium]|nr:hypothetical protein [Myxococcaceae bacterium]MCI0668949.1 hypothetical protein [Myxococcaceae bacterium]